MQLWKKWQWWLIVGCWLAAGSLVSAAAPPSPPDANWAATGAQVRRLTPEGLVQWRLSAPGRLVPAVVSQGSEGTIWLADDSLVDATGRILARGSLFPDQARNRSPQVWEWSPLTVINGGPYYLESGPVLDDQGNALVLLSTGSGGTQDHLWLTRSVGNSGVWTTPELVVVDTNGYAVLAADAQGRLTVIYRRLASGYALRAVRYTPGGGWSAPVTVYSSTYFFQHIEAQADADGNVLVLFDRETTSFRPEIWAIRYDSAGGSWESEPQRLSLSNVAAYVPRLASNEAGDAVFAVYLLDLGLTRALMAHRFNPATQSWGPPIRLPGTTLAGTYLAGPGSRLVAVVDDSGTATVVWSAFTADYQAIYASRFEGGRWRRPIRLLPWSNYLLDLENFGDAATQEAQVIGVSSRQESLNSKVFAWRYDGANWHTDTAYAYSANSAQTRVRVAWYGSDQAVVTFSDLSLPRLQSVAYDGANWGGPSNVPGDTYSFFQESLTRGDEVVLVYEMAYSGLVGGTWWQEGE